MADFIVLEPFVLIEAEVAQAPCARRERRIVGHDHAAFAGRDDLVRIEAEAADRSDAARAPAVLLRAVGLGRVLDHGEPVTRRERHQWSHLRHVAVHVHRHDRARARRDLPRHLGNIEAPRVGLAIHQHRLASRTDDCCRAGDDREARQDHLRAFRQRQRLDREFERRGAVRDRDPVRHAAILCPAPLEFADEASLRNPSRAQRLFDQRAFALAKQRFGNRDHEDDLGPGASRTSDAAMPLIRVLSASPT